MEKHRPDRRRRLGDSKVEIRGTFVAMGDNYYGQRSDVCIWTDIIQVVTGGNHTVGLKADGTVVAVGVLATCNVDAAGGTLFRLAQAAWHTVGLRSNGTAVATRAHPRRAVRCRRLDGYHSGRCRSLFTQWGLSPMALWSR